MPLDNCAPLASSAPLIVYLDYKSPYAFLAMEPTLALGNELGIEIDWRPFTLDITSYLGSARLNKAGTVVEEKRSAGQWARVKYAYYDVRRYGSMRGHTIRGAVKMWDSSLAGIGMLWAKEQGPATLRTYSTIVYERFWKRNLDLEDAGVIETVLNEAGADTKGFQDYASGDGRVAYAHLQRAAFDAGIFGVPTYVIDGELFFGREHLPRIRWMLTGRCGAPPDVEYPIPSSVNAATDKIGEGARLSVAVDFKSPQAYLAIAPTCALARTLGISPDWRPFIGTPSKFIPSEADDRSARHRRIRADYLERDVIRYAADRDLPLDRLHQPQDSTWAAIGLIWANRYNPSLAQSYVERVFANYWRGKLNLEDEGSIRALLSELKIPVAGFEGFAAGDGRVELGLTQRDLRERGVFDVPTYIFADEIFFGRQHLPLLRTRIHA
jgi:2-hydroxychromene-2-carboxylate isomerase